MGSNDFAVGKSKYLDSEFTDGDNHAIIWNWFECEAYYLLLVAFVDFLNYSGDEHYNINTHHDLLPK